MKEIHENVYEEIREDGTYYFSQEYNYIIDDIDPYTGSVEISHREYLDSYRLTYIKNLLNPKVLDLTWLNNNVRILICNNEGISYNLEKVIINYDNLYRPIINANSKFVCEIVFDDKVRNIFNVKKRIANLLSLNEGMISIIILGGKYTGLEASIITKIADDNNVECLIRKQDVKTRKLV